MKIIQTESPEISVERVLKTADSTMVILKIDFGKQGAYLYVPSKLELGAWVASNITRMGCYNRDSDRNNALHWDSLQAMLDYWLRQGSQYSAHAFRNKREYLQFLGDNL